MAITVPSEFTHSECTGCCRPWRFRLNRYFRLGIAAIAMTVALTALSDSSGATVIGSSSSPQQIDNRSPSSGLAFLKAQMNALQDGIKNIKRLRDFFSQNADSRESIISNAERLIGSLPSHENAGEAAWRIAAVASLSLEAGKVSRVEIDRGYRLQNGAIGWDLGIEPTKTHPGFTPSALKNAADWPTITPGSTRPGGIGAATVDDMSVGGGFQASLPNGLFRILIVAQQKEGIDNNANLFSGGVELNGAAIGLNQSIDSDNFELRRLIGRGDTQSASANSSGVNESLHSIGIEGWTVVENGKLTISFGGNIGNNDIAAIIAEPINMAKLALLPEVAEALASGYSAVAPAAGPKRTNPRRARQFLSRRSNTVARNAGAGVDTPAATSGAAERRQSTKRKARFIRSFLDSRVGIAVGGTANSQPEASADNADTVLLNASNSLLSGILPEFSDRQILVKRSDSDGADTEGLAVDLGSLLDNANEFGVFLCTAEPCEADIFALIENAPALTSGAAALGDWLNDPNNLPDGWDSVQSILDTWTPGSEIAAVYSFDVDIDLWTGIELRANTDDGLLVWIDGIFVFGATGPGAAVDDLGFDYQIFLPDLSNGRHVLQIIAESRGPDNPDIFFELRGVPVSGPIALSSANAVPEPGTLGLFGICIAGLLLLRRRERAVVRACTANIS